MDFMKIAAIFADRDQLDGKEVTQQDLDDVITAVRKVCAYYAAKKA